MRFVVIYVLFLGLLAKECSSEDESGPYYGTFIGELNSYHHQTTGEVYAVDEWTIQLVDFNYDGLGEDTYFWAGDSGRPGPQGFIVPDEHNKTNILERYTGANIRLRMSSGRSLTSLAWFSVFDIYSGSAFAEVDIPNDLDVPRQRTLPPFNTHLVKSGPIKVIDSNTVIVSQLEIKNPNADEIFFFVGIGPQPSANGKILPDELGYLEPLEASTARDVSLTIPGPASVRHLSWLGLFAKQKPKPLAALSLRDLPPVPPFNAQYIDVPSSLPRCKQLHRDMQVRWEVFGNQITIQLVGKIGIEEYMSFGVSGSDSTNQMIGSDVAIVYWDSKQLRGIAQDFNISAMAPCRLVLGRYEGVCLDEQIGFLNDKQYFSGERNEHITSITFRTNIITNEAIDRPWSTDGLTSVVWAIGNMGMDEKGNKFPQAHRLFPKHPLFLNISGDSKHDDCFPFSTHKPNNINKLILKQNNLIDEEKRVHTFAIGPSLHDVSNKYYVDGYISPDIYIRRGSIYSFKVYTGNDPHSVEFYHPLVVNNELGVNLAGVITDRRNRTTPTAAGTLCLAKHEVKADRRRDKLIYSTFKAFNRSLVWQCDTSEGAELKLAPDQHWPDVVYYQSYADPSLRGTIHVVDRHRKHAKNQAIHVYTKHYITCLFLYRFLV